ncbi:hypothetical protein [Aromatoleum diolicum]|uniref:Tetratricopeptide repeat-like domain-containing protein n=1 Tax=Aromatoleum diolicum TaxID=75796 RepID=A0ABX1QFF6_9RHOO|nr:hypothetical protein [Aromatoleum diolicum]NMG77152.1 hypothetical protein [Aromatoleum diolicum]
MNAVEKYTTMVVAIIGAVAGLWGAYTAYDASKFKQPFDEHGQAAKSFHSQIASAEARRDSKEIIRVRLLYEKFEEGWRDARKIAELVSPLESLASANLNIGDVAAVKALLASASAENSLQLSSKTLGAAYFAAGDYENAVRHLKDASARADDPQALALQSAAFGELAKNASTENMKVGYENSAVASFRAALASPSGKPVELSGFAKGNADLKAILTSKGVELTRQ